MPAMLPSFATLSRLAAFAGLAVSLQVAAHPLDGLTVDEHDAAIELLRAAGYLGPDAAVAGMHLLEPDKAAVLSWSPGQAYGRGALVVFREGGRVREARIDLRSGNVAVRQVPGVHSLLTDNDYLAATDIALADPAVQVLLARHSIRDLSTIDCFGLAPAIHDLPGSPRVLRVRCAERRGARSVSARVLEGLDILVDVDAARVVHARDAGSSMRTDVSPDFDARALGSSEDVQAVVDAASQGPRIDIEGSLVSWAGWRFHLRTDPRVGLVLSTVTIDDGQRRRSVLYQAHLSEMFVPYMDPAPGWYDRAMLDAGVYSFEGLAESLAPGIDCPPDATFIDGVTTAGSGQSRVRPRIACLFERGTGVVAWRKGVENEARVEGRPTHELVVRMAATVGNYDYLFDWVFQRDGTLRVNVGATGQLAVKVADGDEHGRLVADRVVAVNHDHYFAFRLDLDVDGPVNSFVATQLVPKAAPDNPRKAIWTTRDRTAHGEHDVARESHANHASLWRVVNPAKRNAAGHATGYELRPGHPASPLAAIAELDPVHRIAGFARQPLWVTPYDPAERHAAGDYPMLARETDGLPAWTQDNRSVEKTDLVLWYTVGMHHVPRTEDWPVMPLLWHGFELRPFDFFDRNPVLVPASP